MTNDAGRPDALPVDRLLRPRSIAIVGISDPGSPGATVLAGLRTFGYGGTIHLVSRGRREVLGEPCVVSIDELPPGIDVAALCVPRDAVAEALAACARRRVGGAIVFASGFAEADAAGRAEQDALAAMARKEGLALLGPNCLGLVNQIEGVPLSMGGIEPMRDRALTVGLIAQSGAMMSAIREAARAKGVGFSHMISTGNEAALGAEDFLAALIEDRATRVIALFVEHIRRPKLFLALAGCALQARKPIVLFHSGRGAAARAAARSHTGALAGDFRTMAALTAQEGVVLVESFDELTDVAALLDRAPAPTAGVGIITNSGAFCGIAHDVCEAAGLDIPALSEATVARVRALLPPFAPAANPLDLGTQLMRAPHLLGEAAQALLEDPNIGSLVIATVLGTPQQALDKARAALPILRAAKKPVAFGAIGGEAVLPGQFLAEFDDGKVVLFRSPERALRAVARITAYGRALRRWSAPRRVADVAPAAPPVRGMVPEYLAKPWLAAIGIPMPDGALARSRAEAEKIAARIGYPVVLKAQAKDLAHKSDAGGVMLDIADAAALERAWEKLHATLIKARPDLSVDGVLVERMSPPGVEMVVGARRDLDWGAVVMVGLGGVFVEALDDVRLIAPNATVEEIVVEIGKLRGAKLLAGVRGAPPADVPSLADVVAKIAALMRALPEVAEIDLNPVMVYAKGKGACALDALVVIDGDTSGSATQGC